jgi:HAD superfamily hydrolase (TIGR01549 family)
MAVEAVVFDIGETLVDETRSWGLYADAAGLTRLTFFAALGAVIERREDHRNVFEVLGVEQWIEPVPYERADLYPDAIPCVRRLREAGYTLALVGNQPTRTEQFLRECGLDVDLIASSESWGVQKPDPAFFTRVATWLDLAPASIAYVGDRVDNDVVPAVAAGLTSVFIKRGPWGYLQSSWPEAAQAHVRIDSLAELPAVLS